MKTKEEYIESLAAEMSEWGIHIDILSAKAEHVAANVKLKYLEELDVLREKQQAAVEKMKELEESSGAAWESVKETADKVWDDFRTGYASFVSKFK